MIEATDPAARVSRGYRDTTLILFGEVMDALHQARRGGLDSRAEDWEVRPETRVCVGRWKPWNGGSSSTGFCSVGNFPQAFSHIALVNTAHNLARTTKPAEQRSAS